MGTLYGNVRTLKKFPTILVFLHLKKDSYMDSATKIALVIAVVAAALFLLYFGGGMSVGTTGGGMMGR